MVHRLLLLIAVLAASPAAADPSFVIPIDLGASSTRHAAAEATQVAARTPRMPAVMAASADPARREEMQRAYAAMLAAFEQQLEKQHLPRRDVAIAGAVYVAAAYQGFRGRAVSDAALGALVTQLRDAFAATSAFATAPMARKQDMYEGLAITAIVLAVSHASGQTDAVRDAGKAALTAMLGGDVDGLELTDRGLVRGATKAAPAVEPAAPASGPVAAKPGAAGSSNSAKIEAVLWKTEMHYEAFPSNSMVMREDEYLLLGDGTCTDRVPATLAGFDPTASRASEPKRWCKWRRQGNNAAYEVAFGGTWQTVSGATVLRGAKRGERIAGTWSRSRTGTVGTASTWRGTTLVLRADGTFEYTTAGAYSTNAAPGASEHETVATGVYDDDGSQTTISGKSGGGSIRTSSGRGPADRSGTYVLDGFEIELSFGNGNVERQMFARNHDGSIVRLRGEIMMAKKQR